MGGGKFFTGVRGSSRVSLCDVYGVIPCLQEGCTVLLEVLLASCVGNGKDEEWSWLVCVGLMFAPCPHLCLCV